MKKIKKILFTLLGFVIAIGLLLSMGFVNAEQSSLQCKALDISINQKDELFFIDNLEVAQILKTRGYTIVGQTKSEINIPEIEKILNNHPSVENAEVFLTIDGVLKVNIEQRKPLVRIINKTEESYYIDNNAKLMPLSDNYTKNVIVANGNIFEPYVRFYKTTVNDTAISKKSLLDEIYALSVYIQNDDFWKAQIPQLYVNEEKDIELVPLVGDQRIIFGDTADMEEKFYKLKTFYNEGLNKTDGWKKYSVINLKYKNQIVCIKK